MIKSDIIKECLDLVERQTKLTPLRASASHEEQIGHVSRQNGVLSALISLRGLLKITLINEI